MARPKAKINWDEAGRLAQAGCNGVQIAAYFGIHYNTLEQRSQKDLNCHFSEFLQQNRSHGDALLLAKQFEAALKDKDRGMLIWLGKQRLDQKDKHDHTSKDQQMNPPLQLVPYTNDKS